MDATDGSAESLVHLKVLLQPSLGAVSVSCWDPGKLGNPDVGAAVGYEFNLLGRFRSTSSGRIGPGCI